MPTETIYLCIFRNQQGEKIAVKVSARVPRVGEILSISYLDAQGNFQIVREIQRTVNTEYEVVALEVKPAETEKPSNWLSNRKDSYKDSN